MCKHSTQSVRVLIDEGQGVDDILASNKFNAVNSNINSRIFPTPKDGRKVEKDLVLFNFIRKISSEEAISDMEKKGCKPGEVWDILGLAVIMPDLQRQFPIVALGSVIKRGELESVCFLNGGILERNVCLGCIDMDWDTHCRLLAVKQ